MDGVSTPPGHGAPRPQPSFPSVGRRAWARGRAPGDGGRPTGAPHLSRCSMRKASVSLLAGGSLLTTWRRAVPQAASSGMSVTAPGSCVRGGAAPSRPTPGPLLTSGPQEGRVEAEGDQRLLEPPQKVLEHPTHHMDVSHAAEGGQRTSSPQQPPLPFPHQLLCTRHPVQPCLGCRERGAQPRGDPGIATPTTPAPTSVKPRVSTTFTHCTTSAGTRGGVGGAKSASTPWGGDNTDPLCALRLGRAEPHVPGPMSRQPHGDVEQPPSAAMPPLTSRGQAWWRGRGAQGLGHCSWHLGCSSSWHWRHLTAAFPKRMREPQTPHGSGRITWRGGAESGPSFLQVPSTTPPSPPPKPAPTTSIHPLCRQSWGGRDGGELCSPQTRSSCPSPFSVAAHRRREAGARTVLEANWCWSGRSPRGGEEQGAGTGCPAEPPSVWLSCPAARQPRSWLVPQTMVRSAEGEGSKGDPREGKPPKLLTGMWGGFPPPREPLQHPSCPGTAAFGMSRGPRYLHTGDKHPPTDPLPHP